MPITCDECGKAASAIGIPSGTELLDFISDYDVHGKNAVVFFPMSDAENGLNVVCAECIEIILEKTRAKRQLTE